MTAFNALIDSYVEAPDPGPISTSTAGQVHSSAGPHIADLQGMPPLMGDHNIPLHVAALGILALAVVVGLRVLGFRFSGTAGANFGVGGR